jgi:four helix bundle protein
LYRQDERSCGQSFRDLVVWQRAVDLVVEVYRATKTWPKDEVYGLTNQTRRAAVSVPANIAEGQGRNSPNEFLHQLGVAYGSLCELETHLIIAERLGYIDSQALAGLTERTTQVARPLNGLMRSLRSATKPSR